MSIVSIVLVGAVLLFVAWPLVRVEPEEGDGDDALPPLERQKLDAYAAIKEADFDFRMGKLSEADFATATQRYRQQALAALAAIEKSRARARTGRTSGGAKSIRFAFCPSCGQKQPARANFCGSCGIELRDAVA
jgi:zinc ribbon protein